MTLTTQDIFNKAANHLLTQNAQSMLEHGGCAYRSYDGLMCAVGCLIDDQFYSACLEHSSVHEEDVNEAIVASIGRSLTEKEINILECLQNTHDDTDPGTWADNLDDIAAKFDLEWNSADFKKGEQL